MTPTGTRTTDPYVLSEARRRGWEAELDRLAERGDWARIARALDRGLRFGDTRTEGSWKTQLSDFKKGTRKGLRAFFEAEDRRLDILAAGLGVSADDLRQLLEHVQSGERPDAEDEVRLAGFEDLGPLPMEEVAIQPPLSSLGWSDDERALVATPDTLDLELLAQHVRQLGKGPTVIAIVGPRGSGKTLTLRRLTIRLKTLDTGDKPPVAAVDDLDERGEDERRQLFSSLTQVTLVTMTRAEVARELPEQRLVYTLGRGRREWSLQLLDRLELLAGRLVGHVVHAKSVRERISADPIAASLVWRPEVLGLCFRGSLEKSQTSLAESLIRGALLRAASTLRLAGAAPEAAYVETVGPELLWRLGQLALHRRTDVLSMTEVAGVLADCGRRFAVQFPDPMGAFSLIEACIEGRILKRVGGGLRLVPFELYVAAVGARLDLQSDLADILLQPSWHDALLHAPVDLSLLVEAIWREPAPVVASALGTAAKLLVSRDPSDAWSSSYGRIFEACLRWRSAKDDMSPFVALALAGPKPITRSAPTDAQLERYFQLCHVKAPPPDVRFFAESLVQREALETPRFWTAFRAHGQRGQGSSTLASPLELDLWFELVAGPWMLGRATGCAILAGEHPDIPMETFLRRGQHRFWSEAMSRLPPDRWAAAFGGMCRRQLSEPRAGVLDALEALWKRSDAPQEKMAAALETALIDLHPPRTWSGERLATLTRFVEMLGAERSESILGAWASMHKAGLPLPIFIRAGVKARAFLPFAAEPGAERAFGLLLEETGTADLEELIQDQPLPVALLAASTLASRSDRQARLRAARHANASIRHTLLLELTPESGDGPLWEALLPWAETDCERWLRLVQAWFAGGLRVSEVIAGLGCLVDQVRLGLPPQKLIWSSMQFEMLRIEDAELRALTFEVEVSERLEEVLSILDRALRVPSLLDESKSLIEHIAHEPAMMTMGMKLPDLAAKTLGIAGIVAAGIDTRAVTALLSRMPTEQLRSALDPRSLKSPPPGADRVLPHVLSIWLEREPEKALDWMEQAADCHPDWWGWCLPRLPEGPLRVRAWNINSQSFD